MITSTVAEAFQLGARTTDDGSPFVVVGDESTADHHWWMLTESERTEMLDAVRRLFQMFCPPPRIEDLEVRFMAGGWHGGQGSPLYALASSGAIVSGVQREIRAALIACNDIRVFMGYAEHEGQEFALQAEERAQLHRLLAYVRWHGLRGPVAGWSSL